MQRKKKKDLCKSTRQNVDVFLRKDEGVVSESVVSVIFLTTLASGEGTKTGACFVCMLPLVFSLCKLIIHLHISIH